MRIDRIGEALNSSIEDFGYSLLSTPGISTEKLRSSIIKTKAIIESWAESEPKSETDAKVELERYVEELKTVTQARHYLRGRNNPAPSQILGATAEQAETPEQALPTADADFQIAQLLNVYNLHANMKAFWDDFGSGSKDAIAKLTAAQILPPIAQMQACFREFTKDFEILQNGIRQRRWPTTESRFSQAASLVVTDKLSFDAVAPFKHLITDSEYIIPITYYDQRIYVRQLPYSKQYIFIGLTYDLQFSINSVIEEGKGDIDGLEYAMFDLMAIPHEVGHFMYDHARLEGDTTCMAVSFPAHLPFWVCRPCWRPVIVTGS
jgi:hypothetical protein